MPPLPATILTASLLGPPTVSLYTMGPGDDAFSAFGHAALCVRAPEALDGTCYNYGVADFRHYMRLGWGFVEDAEDLLTLGRVRPRTRLAPVPEG